jgi:SurA N-terminal domain
MEDANAEQIYDRAVRRTAVVVAVVGAAVAAALAVALTRGGSGADDAVALVGGGRITRGQLELMVDHFHEEADREGRPFPKQGTSAYRVVQKQSLSLLVDRAKIEAAAARLGVHVTDAQVQRRIAASGGGEEESGGSIRVRAEAAYLRSTVRSQLVTEAVNRKVTAGIHVSTAAVRRYYDAHRTIYRGVKLGSVAAAIRSQLLAARRNAALTAWLSRARRSVRAEIRDPKLQG